jgi:hypothetical protein
MIEEFRKAKEAMKLIYFEYVMLSSIIIIINLPSQLLRVLRPPFPKKLPDKLDSLD